LCAILFDVDFEKEIKHGLLELSPDDSCIDGLAFCRTIVDLTNFADLPLVAVKFAETCCFPMTKKMCLDPVLGAKLAALKDKCTSLLHPKNVICNSILFRHDDGVDRTLHGTYLDEMATVFYDRVSPYPTYLLLPEPTHNRVW